MRQVDQRVSVRCELTALDAQGVVGYVNHRLVVAGLGGSSVEFTAAALEAIHHGSGGVPRVINRLCDRTLERAYAAGTRTIDSESVWDAIEDLGPAHGIAERASVAKPAAKDPSVPLPSPSPALESVTIINVPAEAPSALMEEFRSEADLPVARPRSTAHSVTRRQWAAVAAASMLIVAASVGVPACYLRAHMVDHDVVTAPGPPPLPPPTFSPPSALAPTVNSSDTASSPEDAAAPTSVSEAREEGTYTIMVASFTNPERAQRLVEELTNAGYRARAVEHDWGPPRGRLLQVNVGGYVSATDAERDLQQIRELPGGYRDARVIVRE